MLLRGEAGFREAVGRHSRPEGESQVLRSGVEGSRPGIDEVGPRKLEPFAPLEP
jgi:hypothetical protein